MQNGQSETNAKTAMLSNKKTSFATEHAHKPLLGENHTKGNLSLNVTNSPKSLPQSKNAVGKMPTPDPHNSLSNINGGGLDTNQSVTGFTATEQEELGFINDLVKLGLPREPVSEVSNQNVSNSSQSGLPQANLVGSNSINTGSFTERSLFDVDKGYTSDTTDLSQDRYKSSSYLNDDLGDTEHLQQQLQKGASSSSHIDPESKKGLKSDKKVKERKIVDKNSNKKNLDKLLFSTLPPTQHENNDERHLTRRTTGPRVQTSSKPGSPKFIRPNSKPGVLSDDEYIINASSTFHRHGRRSAPIFTKRGFSASEFWNSGKTAIERTHMQDLVNSRFPERQKAKSPTTNIFVNFPSKVSSLSQNLRRPRSADPSNFSNTIKNDSIKKEPVQSGTSSQSSGKVFFMNYGSTDNAVRRVDNHGYPSELDTKDWKVQDSTIFQNKQHPSSLDGMQHKGQMGWHAEDVLSSNQLNNPLQNTSGKARTQAMKGVFHTPHLISPHDLQVRVSQGKDSTQTGKQNFGYFLENKAQVSLKKSSATSSSDESGGEDINDSDRNLPLLVKSSDASEDTFDVKTETRTEVYSRRWYLLLLFSLTAMLWNAIWSTWGPIAQSAKSVYNWDDGDIAMFTYLGNIPFLITMFPCAYLMDVSGMRMAMIFCCGFMFVGAGFRCIPGDIYTSTWLIRIGQTINGIAGTIPSSGPALLSGLWFPPNQRATATAISTVAGYMGASISFIIGPLLVPEPSDLSPVNGTTNMLGDDIDTNGSTNGTGNFAQEQGIRNILYGEFGLAALLLVLVLAYFPSKPPLPPSISASIPREKYLNGLKMLMTNKQFWICAIAFSVPIGVYESWQVILDINLDSKGISQQTAGWLDFYATVGGCVSGLLVSRFADLFTRQMKLFLLVFYSFATVAILWLTLVVLDIIPFDEVSIYAAIIITGIFLDGGSPLFFELTIEVSYPVGEGVTSGFMHMMCAAAGTGFLIIVQIQSIGTEWMNWCFLGCVALTIPLMLFINTTYSRADIDDMEIDISDDEEAITGIGAADTNEKTSLLKNSTV